jgi:nitrite reductase/ring-hydroxylating ferredoxin subunit
MRSEMDTPTPAWQPVLPSFALRAAQNIVAGFLNGEELALWRSREGIVQAWDNRCPHRGTRLTLGRIVQGRLACAYHGWEFEADSGQCATVPAHPGQPAPRGVCVKTYRASEAQGMVWVAGPGAQSAALDARHPAPIEEPPAPFPELPAPSAGTATWFCRSLAVRAALPRVVQVLRGLGLREVAPWVWHGELAQQALTLFLNDAQPRLVFLHAWRETEPDASPPPMLAQTQAALRRLRETIETHIESAQAGSAP